MARVPSPEQGAWIPKYEALHCEPQSIHMASREPLRFAVLGRCERSLPPRHSRRLSLVVVDAARDEVSDFAFEGWIPSRTLSPDLEGRWRWLAPAPDADARAQTLALLMAGAGDPAPRALASLTLPFYTSKFVNTLRGDDCWLMAGTVEPEPGEQWRPVFAFVDVAGQMPVARATPPLRGMRFWHPREKAFVVQTAAQQTDYALLDCAGNQRPLPEPDASRMQLLSRDGEAAIAPNGDWLFASQSGVPGYGEGYDPEDEIHFLQDKSRDVFGPFVGRELGCTDTGCDFETDRLEDPEWSPSGRYFLVQGYPRGYVLQTGGVRVVHKLRYFGSPGRAVFLSDSLVMALSKSRGVKFYRW